MDEGHAPAPLVLRLFRRVHPARLAFAAFGQAAAAFPAWQRLLRARLRAAAGLPGGGFRPLAVRCPGPWRQRSWRAFPWLEPQRRAGVGGVHRGPQAFCRGAVVCRRPQFWRGPDQPDAGPAAATVSARGAARSGVVHPGDDRGHGAVRRGRPEPAQYLGEQGAQASPRVAGSRGGACRAAWPRDVPRLARRRLLRLYQSCLEGHRGGRRVEVPAEPRGGNLLLLPQATVAVAGQGDDADPGALWPAQLPLRRQVGGALVRQQSAHSCPGGGWRALLYAGAAAGYGRAGRQLPPAVQLRYRARPKGARWLALPELDQAA